MAMAILAGRLMAQQLLPANEFQFLADVQVELNEQPNKQQPFKARGGKKCLRYSSQHAAPDVKIIGQLPAQPPVPVITPPLPSTECFELLFRRSGYTQLFQKS